MGNSILDIGISGLNAAQTKLLTTSHNISNADTPSYSRQEVLQSNNMPQTFGSGFVGRGVHVATVQRVYNQFLVNQSLQVQTQSNQLESHYTQIKQIDDMLADSSSGLSPSMLSFFNALQDVATNPASVPSRQALLSNAEALTARFHSMDQRLEQIRDGINTQITSSVSEINSLAKQIAELNQHIMAAEGAAGGQPANDMMDQRDELAKQLNQLINANVVKQSDGSFNVFVGNGLALVVGSESMALSAMISPDNPEELTIGFVSGNNTIQLPENQIQGGSLSGILTFRKETLDTAQNSLGRIAVTLAQTFNDIHQLGQDLNSNLGGDFFVVPTPKVISAINNNVASTITASISSVSALTTSNYKFSFDGTNYTLTRLSDNSSVSSLIAPSGASPLVMDGVSVTSATINANESFLIQPTQTAARDIEVLIKDTSEIAAAAPIRTNAAVTNKGNGTINQGSVNPLPLDPNLQQPVTFTFHVPYDGQFDVTGIGTGLPATNQVYTAGADISFNGFTVQINGQPAAGDIFTIGPNTSGKADNRNALLLGSLQSQNTLANGTASYQDAYGQLVSFIGNKTRELEITSKTQGNLLAQTERSIQALSGVNLDEEAANLLRYQQAFQASSKVIEISSTLFESILRIS